MGIFNKTPELRCLHRKTARQHPNCHRNNNMVKLPKVLLLDIETLPMQVFVWGLYKQRISPDNVVKDWSIVSWSAKWLFSSESMSSVVTSREALENNDRRIIEDVWKLMNSADIIIGHNSNSFDIKKLNTRFLLHGLPPPMYYQTIDTLSVLRNKFKISSNSLDYVTKFLGIGEKVHTTFELWKRCVVGDKEALQEMVTYNQGDVSLLEEVYVKIRPWITGHPNIGIYVDTNESVCPNCGSSELSWGGEYVTQCGKYNAFRCKCGAIGRSRINELSKEKASALVRS